MISLVVISGRSGSGKSTALHVLEDMGYYCIDNLPVTLLRPLIDKLLSVAHIDRVAVSIDARNIAADLALFPELINSFDASEVDPTVIYLDARSPELVSRFSASRRKHPLSSQHRDLREALELETRLLDPVADRASLSIDTTSLSLRELRDEIKTRVARERHELALRFLSFAFKRGVPVDADFVFDIRCLPNPYWNPELRHSTGLDPAVQAFLTGQDEFNDMEQDIKTYLGKWLPRFETDNRSYLTAAIGCTGGQHRSVYMCQRLFDQFRTSFGNVQVKHRELDREATN